MRWSDLRDGSGAHGRLGTLTTLALRAALLALALQGTVFGQSRTAGTGSITGTARDASGLVLPGATIAAKNLRTGETADATSNAQGGYLFAALNPSTYTVTARLTGFAPVEFKDVQLLAGQEVRLDVTLAPATQSETVTVTGEAPLLDVSDARAIENFKPSFDRLDVLVLAQGAVIYRRGEFEMAGFRKVLEVNLISLMACATKFHTMLSAAKGSLIIVSSTAAYHSTKGNPSYNASKTGAVGLTRTLGEAWAEDGIRVNGIAPGLVDTKMTKVTTANPKRLEGAIERIPLKRLGTPADMAGAALFLASPLASYIVGQTLVVDGGLIL